MTLFIPRSSMPSIKARLLERLPVTSPMNLSGVTTSIPKLHRDIHHFKSCENSTIQAFFESLFTRYDIFLWNNPSFDCIHEFETWGSLGVFRQIFELFFGQDFHLFYFYFYVTIISASARLLDIFSFCL